MLSRAKPAVGGDLPHTDKRRKKGRKIPKLEELLSQRDFTGAITLLEVISRNACEYLIGGGWMLGWMLVSSLWGFFRGSPGSFISWGLNDLPT